MKRQWKKILCLLIVLLTLGSCSPSPEEGKVFAEVTQYLGVATQAPTTAPQAAEADGEASSGGNSIFDNNPYTLPDVDEDYNAEDPLGEEEYDYYGEMANSYGFADVYATVYPYAGSTPIPLDPVNMPSPTPRPDITFSYAEYTIPSLALAFKGPLGWIPEEGDDNVYTLTEPESQKKDGQLGVIKISAVPVNQDYSESNLKTEITQRLKEIGSTNFDVWDPSLTASRHLMGQKGVYANYSGTLANGVQVGGRIHSTCISQVLYTIEILYPLGYKDNYIDVFSEMRSSIKRQ